MGKGQNRLCKQAGQSEMPRPRQLRRIFEFLPCFPLRSSRTLREIKSDLPAKTQIRKENLRRDFCRSPRVSKGGARTLELRRSLKTFLCVLRELCVKQVGSPAKAKNSETESKNAKTAEQGPFLLGSRLRRVAILDNSDRSVKICFYISFPLKKLLCH
jgi:hypothetical protein